QYVYQQSVRSSMVRTNGQIARKETREYAVVPKEKTTDKTLVSFSGEYRDGKRMVPYSQPDQKDKGSGVDRGLIKELAEGLVNARDSRDGIPHDLFPIRSDELPYYKFSLKGQA